MAEEPEEQIFDPSLKKKKKKKKTTFDPDALTTAPETKVDEEGAADDADGMNMSSMKESLPPDSEEPAPNPDDEFGFGKKKKKPKGQRITIQDEPEIITDEADKPIKVVEGDYAKTDADYTYDQLLTRAFGIMRERNPDIDSGERKRFVMKPPQMAKVGTKKTAFANFADICRLLKRQPKHLLQFLLAELGTSGNVDANNSLILKGRYQQKHIESVLRRYIKEYVTCHTCRSPDTVLERETRLFFLQCQNCQSRSSVASIKSGFQAITGKRAAMRAKTA